MSIVFIISLKNKKRKLRSAILLWTLLIKAICFSMILIVYAFFYNLSTTFFMNLYCVLITLFFSKYVLFFSILTFTNSFNSLYLFFFTPSLVTALSYTYKRTTKLYIKLLDMLFKRDDLPTQSSYLTKSKILLSGAPVIFSCSLFVKQLL